MRQRKNSGDILLFCAVPDKSNYPKVLRPAI